MGGVCGLGVSLRNQFLGHLSSPVAACLCDETGRVIGSRSEVSCLFYADGPTRWRRPNAEHLLNDPPPAPMKRTKNIWQVDGDALSAAFREGDANDGSWDAGLTPEPDARLQQLFRNVAA